LRENSKAKSEIERTCYEAKVYRDGKEVFVSDELRKRVYGVIAFLPVRNIIDRGYTAKDRKKLPPREAAAVSLSDEKILTDLEFQKEVKDYLLKSPLLQKNFDVIGLEKNETAMYALFFLGHECVKNYMPKKQKEPMFEEADEGKDFVEQLYGKKAQRH